MENPRNQNRTRYPAAISKREFLKRAAGAVGAWSVAPAHLLAGDGGKSSSDKLNIAGVGLGFRGYENLRKCATENIVALCDVDWKLAAPAAERFPDAKTYTDYRRMFDEQKHLDAVIIATPDHTHAVITAEAMRRGCHVYTEMPLAHDVREARRLAEIARDTGVVTQMGNESHSHYMARRVCEWVWSGKLGAIREVECWTNRPEWAQGMDAPPKTCSPPKSLNWDLWLGPAPMHDYSPAYHPCDWKGWRDFGTGALGAMGCYVIDPAYWALKLDEAPYFAIEAESTGLNRWSYPCASTVRYHFPARGDLPPVTLTWRDGGRKPPLPDGWPDNRHPPCHGSFLLGEKHTLAVDQVSQGYGWARLIPESLMYSVDLPPKKLPRLEEGPRWNPTRHQQEWVNACKSGNQPGSNFDYSGPLTEMVLLGNVALAAGQRLEWDKQAMKITNDAAADDLLRRSYREGWSL
ncbi:MAG: Gfo/Idh/MocA family oxidoreductase [Pirellulaceae bacterium]